MNRLLKTRDPAIYNIIRKEYNRQKKVYLIASENFTSKSVMECLRFCSNQQIFRRTSRWQILRRM